MKMLAQVGIFSYLVYYINNQKMRELWQFLRVMF
jgi:hypothetical protein